MTSYERRKIWYDMLDKDMLLIDKRISDGIEKNRKGNIQIKLTDKSGRPVAGKRVKILQKSHDFKFGANLFMLKGFETERENAEYEKAFKELFNLATVPFYWNTLEPEQGKPRFSEDSPFILRRPPTDLCVEFCEKQGIAPKLHCLVYDNYIPDWLPKGDMKQMEYYYEKRVSEIAERYAGRMYEFEVINETLSTRWWHNQSVISGRRDVVEWAFALAKKYLPNEKLIINDGYPLAEAAIMNYRSTYFLQLEKCLLNKTPIDKIGTQHHIFVGNTARTEEEYDASVREHLNEGSPLMHLKALDVLAELGLPLELTELTIPTFGDTAEDEELQAELVRIIYSVWFSHPAVESVVYWNLVDGCAFKSENADWYCDENNCRGGFYHRDLTPKKSALMLSWLINGEWRTEKQEITDKNGCINLRGFYGDYSLEIDGEKYGFGLHKNGDKAAELVV